MGGLSSIPSRSSGTAADRQLQEEGAVCRPSVCKAQNRPGAAPGRGPLPGPVTDDTGRAILQDMQSARQDRPLGLFDRTVGVFL